MAVQVKKYEAVIGLEIHVEFLTKSKMFCGSAVTFGEKPNTHTCPICLGMPGTLPVANAKAIEYLVMIGVALNCTINEFCQFHRKNYFYPDMPKDYQISQYDIPVASNGHLDINVGGVKRKIDITRAHMEEDTGKLLHSSKSGRLHEAKYSVVDFNRAGTPLGEIVTEPDIRTPEEAAVFVSSIRSIVQHLGVSDGNMEEGSLRVDANISLREAGSKELGVKTEVKNMNSLRSLRRALDFETERQEQDLRAGEDIIQETRHWDESAGRTSGSRRKEEAHDYRYFPDPDLVPFVLKADYVEGIKAKLPELPEERTKRFSEEYNLAPHDAVLLTQSKAVGDYFDEAAKLYRGDAKSIANWIIGEFAFHLKNADMEIDESAVTTKHLVNLLKLIENKTISGKIAKEVFDEMFNTGKLPDVIVEEKGLVQIVDEGEIEKIVDAVLEENAGAVEDLKAGKDKAFGFLVGQVMRLSKGKANPELANRLIREKTK